MTQLKVFMPVPREDWVCDVIIDEFKAHSRHSFVDDIKDADVVWHYAKWIATHFQNVLRDQHGHKPTITTVHHIVPGKDFDVKLYDSFTDMFHVPNYITGGQLALTTTRPVKKLSYWINDKKFVLRAKGPENTSRLIGSFQRDTEGKDLISPKLEKGPDIFIDVMTRLKKLDVQVVLAGWRRQFVIRGLQSLSIPYEYYEKYQRISDLYALCDYYLVTSRYEGGPQAVLEAAQMGVRVLSTPVGMAPEVLDPTCICKDAEEMAAKLIDDMVKGTLEYTVKKNHDSVQALLMGKLIPKYDDLVEEVHARFHQS